MSTFKLLLTTATKILHIDTWYCQKQQMSAHFQDSSILQIETAY